MLKRKNQNVLQLLFLPRGLRGLQYRRGAGVLESYATRLADKEQQVEGLRQAAISAGINGDGAGVNIAFFRNEEQELMALRATLAPLVNFSRETLAGLQNDLDLLHDGASSLSAHARRSSKTVQASARPER